MLRAVRVNERLIVHDTLDGEVLAIRNDTGTYYSMVGPAADVWSCILAGCDVAAIAKTLSARYDVDQSVVAQVTGDFVQQLIDQRLVVEGSSPSGTSAPEPLASRLPWSTPVLELYTDMQDLLLFDPIHEVRPEGWPHVSDPST